MGCNKLSLFWFMPVLQYGHFVCPSVLLYIIQTQDEHKRWSQSVMQNSLTASIQIGHSSSNSRYSDKSAIINITLFK